MIGYYFPCGQAQACTDATHWANMQQKLDVRLDHILWYDIFWTLFGEQKSSGNKSLQGNKSPLREQKSSREQKSKGQ